LEEREGFDTDLMKAEKEDHREIQLNLIHHSFDWYCIDLKEMKCD
jgi:hypothetical protein